MQDSLNKKMKRFTSSMNFYDQKIKKIKQKKADVFNKSAELAEIISKTKDFET